MTGPTDGARVRREVLLPVCLGGYATEARLFTFDGLHDRREHLALGLGASGAVPLVRLHSECLTGDVLGSQRCDCGPQLRESVERIDQVGGYLLYLRQEGRGIGLYNKVDAYTLQDAGLDTYEANRALGFDGDERDYSVAAAMLRALGVHRLDLLTNNPDKATQLGAAGLDVRRTVPTGLHLTAANRRYLAAKAHHGHRLPSPPSW